MRDGDALVLGVRLHLVQELDAVVGAFLIGHAAAIAGEGDEVGHLIGRTLVDRGAERGVELRVVLAPVERVGNRAAGAQRVHRRDEAVLLQDWPVGRANQVEPADAELRGFAAGIVERHATGKYPACDALLDAALSLHRCNSLSRDGRLCQGEGSGEGQEEVSAFHLVSREKTGRFYSHWLRLESRFDCEGARVR